jgi:hypothetical protein
MKINFSSPINLTQLFFLIFFIYTKPNLILNVFYSNKAIVSYPNISCGADCGVAIEAIGYN